MRQGNEAPIRKIRLFGDYFSERHWVAFEGMLMSVAAALSSSPVRELEIVILIDVRDKPSLLSVPLGIFNCETLVSLSLKLGMDWTVPDFVCLPNLNELDLDIFKLVDEACIEKFLQGCPMLEQLKLSMQPSNHQRQGEQHIEVKCLKISSPVLNRLTLCLEGFESEFSTVVHANNLEHLSLFTRGRHKVAIDAPYVRSLKIGGYLLEVNFIRNLISFDEAKLRLDFLRYVRETSDLISCSEHVFEFVRGLQNAKSISFPERILIALYISGRVFPTFRNLIKLHLGPFDFPAFPREWMSILLSRLFESSPNLEVLIFSEVSEYYFSQDEELDSVFHESLAPVLVEHLKEIEIANFKGKAHELKLVEFFLKSGKSLKKMSLFGYPSTALSEGLDRILSFKKCSGDCQIVSKHHFDWLARSLW